MENVGGIFGGELVDLVAKVVGVLPLVLVLTGLLQERIVVTLLQQALAIVVILLVLLLHQFVEEWH